MFAVAIVAAGCGGDDDDSSASTTSAASGTSADPDATTTSTTEPTAGSTDDTTTDETPPWRVTAQVHEFDADGLATFHVIPKNGRVLIDDVALVARQRGWEVEQIFIEPGRLDEVFREITTTGAAARS